MTRYKLTLIYTHLLTPHVIKLYSKEKASIFLNYLQLNYNLNNASSFYKKLQKILI